MRREVIKLVAGHAGESRIEKLLQRGLIGKDGHGFYAITAKGRDACPYRNRHLEARRLQRRKNGQGASA